MGLILRAKDRVSWHRKESPLEFAAVQIESGDVSTHARIVRAGVANDHGVSGNDRAACHRVRKVLLASHQCIALPDWLSGVGVEGIQVTIEGADVHATFPYDDSATDSVAARVASPLHVDVGDKCPAFCPCGRINRVHSAEITDGEKNSVDNARARL